MSSCFKMGSEGKEKNEWSTNFLKNGEKLLEGMIASSGGKCNPIRSFPVKDLREATNNFHDEQIILREGAFVLYRGSIGNRPISVKLYKESKDYEYSITDIVIGSQMSVHNNVLKLLGCCLETAHPMVVYEFVGNFTLHNYIYATIENKGLQPLPWKCRIRVAMRIANAIAYLHTALLRPVVHRDIKPRAVVMDGKGNPKLLHFSFSVAIPEGETQVETGPVIGTPGFIDPGYCLSNILNEKSDVYSFGILLLMLLTGRNPYDLLEDDGNSYLCVDGIRKYIQNNRLWEILDPGIGAELGKEEQIQEFCALELRCVQRKPEDRPTMIEVGKELYQMHRQGAEPATAF